MNVNALYGHGKNDVTTNARRLLNSRRCDSPLYSQIASRLADVVMRALVFVGVGSASIADYSNRQTKTQPRLVLTIEKSEGSLDLVVVNKSRVGIWVEAVNVELIDLETGGITYRRPAPAVHKIGLFLAPVETVHISLTNTVYNAAGRPAGMYSCSVSTVLLYRVKDDDGEQFEQPVLTYYADLISLVPVSLRLAKPFDRPLGSGRREDVPRFGTRGNRVRRSQRVVAESAVVVEGTFSDGRPFSESTYALVLSVHGCLVQMTKPVEIGESFVLRNVCTQQKQCCQVVYIGEMHSNRIQVGLSFEAEAPEFWGAHRLPSLGNLAV